MEERRKFFRFESPINVKYALEKDETKGRSQTKNISREGVAFSTDKELSKKDRLRMEFEIFGDNIPVFAEGVVAWVKKDEKEKRRIFDIGVRLTQIKNFDRGRILEYAYEQWLKIKNISRKGYHESKRLG